ncbi:MAG: S26 family signal peptidase [Pirellulaceae bacterium]|nr:S26 family signal peptidase [Pirellulaceae bacterium]
MCAALLVATVTRGAFLRGVWRPVRVSGGSMAETFSGPHFAVTCRDCGFPFRCGVEYPPRHDDATCPNCGSGDNPVVTTVVEPGQRVLIDRWPALVRRLDVWQPVAFRTPAEPAALTVKRLVARGPGRVWIRDGDVYVDDHVQQKELTQLRAVRVIVHDDRFRAAGPPRWQARDATSLWRRTPRGYRRDDSAGHRGPIDWLAYQQWTCWPQDDPRRPRTHPVAVVDQDAYNQSLSRGNLHPVPDLMLSCRIGLSPDARCTLRLVSRTDTFDWELDAGHTRWQLLWNGAAASSGQRPARRGPWYVEFAVCDHRVLAALDGTTVVQFDYQPGVSPGDFSATRVAIGAAGSSMQCDAIRLHRDLYYLGPGGAVSWMAPNRLECGQWFVLGDNVPISIDSRFWSALEEPLIAGVVRRWVR